MERNVLEGKRDMLRHFLAVLAYRTQKALRGAPPEFSTFRPKQGVRTPHQTLCHMTNVLGYARTFLRGGTFRCDPKENFNSEISRFHEMLKSISEDLQQGALIQGTTPERILQGPFSDAMSHAGQLSMMRRFFGSPIPPENFIVADINADNVSANQTDPVSSYKTWHDAEGRIQKG
jgi:hypothetical protein